MKNLNHIIRQQKMLKKDEFKAELNDLVFVVAIVQLLFLLCPF